MPCPASSQILLPGLVFSRVTSDRVLKDTCKNETSSSASRHARTCFLNRCVSIRRVFHGEGHISTANHSGTVLPDAWIGAPHGLITVGRASGALENDGK